jgi:alpha-galactosidase
MIAAQVEHGLLTVVESDGSTLLSAHGEALLSDGRVLSTRDGNQVAWQVDQADDGVIVRLRLRDAGRVEQLRPLVAPVGYKALPLRQLRIQQTGWQSWSRTHPPAPFEPNLQTAAPPIRGPYLPHRRKDSQLEPWMTILSASGSPSLLLGFVSAHTQLGSLEIAPAHGEGGGDGHSLLAATELDGVSGMDVVSEPLLIATGAESDLLQMYANAVATHMNARVPREVLTGWCSWYQLYTSVSEADVDRNLSSLAERRDQLPLHVIQLDDGYQHAVGDWLELNEKFPSGMPAVVERIKHRGFMPGLWLAPFLLSAASRTYAAHPDWVVRDDRGQPLNAIDNWGSANYAVDTTHPAVQDWLQHVISSVCNDWGYDYLKLDFLYAAAMRGQRFDQTVTGTQAYCRGLELIRRIAGDRFILGCGAPLVPSVGLVDGMRIGSDVAAYWGAQGNADGPALRNATRATLARGWMHGRWWTNDPDCVVIRTTDTQLSLAEVQAWLAVVALSGGMLFVGDDVSRVESERLDMLSRLFPPSGHSAASGPPLVGQIPERLHLRVGRPFGAWSVVGVANWSDVAVQATFDPAEFQLEPAQYHVVDLWTGAYLGLSSQPVDLGQVPAHAMRLLSVHPERGRPQTIGSTGHLLGEAMDLADEVWDAGTGTLTLWPSSRGPRTRNAEFLVAHPNGPPRRIPFSAAAGAPPIRVQFG